jgi:hypothetical protein
MTEASLIRHVRWSWIYLFGLAVILGDFGAHAWQRSQLRNAAMAGANAAMSEMLATGAGAPTLARIAVHRARERLAGEPRAIVDVAVADDRDAITVTVRAPSRSPARALGLRDAELVVTGSARRPPPPGRRGPTNPCIAVMFIC